MAFAPTAQALDPGLALDQYAHDRWDTKDGLPQGAVLSIHQTSNKYLWLGTQAALVRFDGQTFTTFGSAPGTGQYSFVRDLTETSDGKLWAAAMGGVISYDHGTFTLFDESRGLVHPFTFAIVPGPGDSIWAGSGGSGVWLLRDGEFALHPAYATPGLPSKINDLAKAPDGTLWAATDGGIIRLSIPPRLLTTRDGLPSPITNVLLFDADGTLWVGTRAGLAFAIDDSFEVVTTRDGLAHDDVTALLEDSDGGLWIGTQSGGLHRWAAGNLEGSSPDLSRGGPVLTLSEDRDGNVWVGRNDGLERFRNGSFVTAGQGQGFATDRMHAVLARRTGGLWVLDGGGALYTYENGRARMIAPTGTVEGEGALGMLESSDGTLWVGSRQLLRYTRGQWAKFEHPGGDFGVLANDADGTLLVSQTDGSGTSTLSRFDGTVFSPLTEAGSLHHVQRLMVDSERRIWISTGGNGLVRLGKQGRRAFTKEDGLPHDIVYGVVEGLDGAFWVATRGGLAHISAEDVVTSLAATSGLPRQSPSHLQLDDLAHLWITSDEGIHRVPLVQLEAAVSGSRVPVRSAHYGLSDGLRSIDISRRGSGQTKTSDGRLWYATSRGLSHVDPSVIVIDTTAPSVEIVSAAIDGRKVHSRDIQLDEPAERIEVAYTAPGIGGGELIEFRYRLAGYERKWVSPDTERAAHYTNVPDGSYTFEVVARRNHGPWGNEPTTLSLVIAPAWYETWWAQALLACSAALSLFGLYSLRVRQLKQRELELVHKVEERTRELRKEVSERRLAEDKVRKLNAELEGNVRERTAQLVTVNQALIEDVQKRQSAEAQLADEKERLAVTLGSITDGVIAVDVSGQVMLMNRVAEQYTGWQASEARGKALPSVFRAIARDTRQPLPTPVADVLSGSRARSEVERAVLLGREGGSETSDRLVDASAAPIKDAKDQLIGAVLAFRDVTERTRAEEQLRKTQKLESLGVLAGGIAHDFNNMLTGIFCHVDMARKSIPDDSPARRWLDDTMAVLENAKGLARQLLTFSSGGKPTLESHSLSELLRDSSRFVLSGSKVSVDLQIPRDLWPCDMDPVQIRQVVDNLIINARQAMSDGGNLHIIATNLTEAPDSQRHRGQNDAYAQRWVEIAFRDEGPGIAPDVIDRIFDPFFTTKDTGSGLGLATVHSIASKHGGKIDVESHPGRGTTFRLRLRAATAPSVSLPPHALMALSPSVHTTTRSVLVMDDEYPIRRVAGAALEGAGYDVVLTSSGDEAVDVFTQRFNSGRGFDLVILDLTIAGGMGGAETLQRLRKINPGVQAIASSGYASGTVLGDPNAHGFNAALPKPYTVDDLVAAVAAMLRAA